MLGFVYRLADGVWLVLALVIVSSLSTFPWFDPQWRALYLLAAACAVGLFYLAAEYYGLYLAARGISRAQEISRLWWVWFSVLLGLLLIAYGTKMSADYPRRVMLSWFIVAPLMLTAWRMVLGAVLRSWRSRGHGQQAAAVVGSGEMARRVAQNVFESPWMGMRLQGVYDDSRAIGEAPFEGLDVNVCGSIDDVLVAAKEGQIDAVYIALPTGQEARSEALISQLADTPVSVFVIPNLFMFDLLHARWLSMNGVPVISVFESPFYGVDGTIKRVVDICFSIVILIVVALPMLLVAIGIKLDSPGSILFRQRRYGLDGREILVWKFRTMRSGSDSNEESKQATRDDPRVTRFGAFLRRHSLDELPQFFNVLQGRMSIVGPRPHPVALNEQHRQLIRGYMLRHRVKPGITGLAQVSGSRGETETLEKMAKRIEYDLAYIRDWTLWLDFKIILQTIFKGFRDQNAY